MDDKEKIQSFGDMVEASEKITKPWRHFCAWLLAALVATNLIWGFVHWKQLQYAYMTPEEFEQTQQFDAQTQEQHYSQGAAQGN